MKWIKPEDCIANNVCWTQAKLERYTAEHGVGGEVDVKVILADPSLSVVEKMFIVDIAKLLKPADAHWLAVEFAAHWMEDANKDGLKAVQVKAMWLKDQCDDQVLLEAENNAWRESYFYKKSKSAAFAAKKDPYVALRGAAAFAGGWYGSEIDPDEKKWQWSLILDRLGAYDA